MYPQFLYCLSNIFSMSHSLSSPLSVILPSIKRPQFKKLSYKSRSSLRKEKTMWTPWDVKKEYVLHIIGRPDEMLVTWAFRVVNQRKYKLIQHVEVFLFWLIATDETWKTSRIKRSRICCCHHSSVRRFKESDAEIWLNNHENIQKHQRFLGLNNVGTNLMNNHRDERESEEVC